MYSNYKKLFVDYTSSFSSSFWDSLISEVSKIEHVVNEKSNLITINFYLSVIPSKKYINCFLKFFQNNTVSGVVDIRFFNVPFIKKNINSLVKCFYDFPASSIKNDDSLILIELNSTEHVLEYQSKANDFLLFVYALWPNVKVEIKENLPSYIVQENDSSELPMITPTPLFLWHKESQTNHKLQTKYKLGFTNWTDFYWFAFSNKDPDKQKELYDYLEPDRWYDCVFDRISSSSRYSKDIDGFLNSATLSNQPHQSSDTENLIFPLSIHTKNSAFDGINTPKQIIAKAKEMNIKYLGFTDMDSVQSFCEISKLSKSSGIVPIYGLEIEVVDEEYPIVVNDCQLWDNQHICVFDIETTGLYPFSDDLLQISVKKINLDFSEVDNFNVYVKTNSNIPEHISRLTGITNEIIQQQGQELKEVLVKTKEFIKSSLLIAHNGINFDLPFLNAKLRKCGLEEIKEPLLDPMRLSQYLFLDKNVKAHNLKAIAKKASIEYDEQKAHSADYDVAVLSSVFKYYLIPQMREKNLSLSNLSILNKKLWNEQIYSYVYGKNVLLYIKNQQGVEDLYRLVSEAHTNFFHNSPKLTRAMIDRYRENLIVVSSQLFSQPIDLILRDDLYELSKDLSWYDYISIFPPSLFFHEIQRNYMSDQTSIDVIKTLVQEVDKANKPYLINYPIRYSSSKEWERYSVLINTEAISGKRHPLYKRDSQNENFPLFHIRTFKEIKDEFESLDMPELFSQAISNQSSFLVSIDPDIEVVKDSLHPPFIDNCKEMLKDTCWHKLLEIYGSNPDEYIVNKYNQEVTSICNNNYEVIYWVSYLLVKKSREDGYLVGSRGSVGSSFVAYLMNISEINPLPPHYRCKSCSYFEMVENFSDSGFDLPPKICPHCNNQLETDGQNIPFETFLGFDGNKVPDIDLNFSGEYQSQAHAFLKEYFGEDQVFKAGTISTIAKKTAYATVMEYLEMTNQINITAGKRRWLEEGVLDVKRTTGQHPGGILVLPKNRSIYEFTPINYPANDKKSAWFTTHFEFEYLHDSLLKFDILGHDDPTALAKLTKITGIDPSIIKYNDPKILNLYKSSESLNISPDVLIGKDGTGALALPEFGTSLTRDIIKKCQPSSFADLIRISGFSHGTGVWRGNIDELIKDKEKYPLNKVITCRDDIMLYLISMNLSRSDSFNITEDIRKGKGVSNENESLLKKHKVPSWWINSARKISYIFPKAHASAYVLMSWKLAFYKLYYPLAFYSVWFGLNMEGFDYDLLRKNNIDILKEAYRSLEINTKKPGSSSKAKDKAKMTVFEVAVEFLARGYKFSDVNINYSLASEFEIYEDEKSLIPPLSVINGLGTFKSQQIVDIRNESGLFDSPEDLIARTPLSKVSVEKLKEQDIFPKEWMY